MNIKNIANKTMVIGCCLLASGACLTACNGDDDKYAEPDYRPVPPAIATGDLKLSADTVEVGVGETETFTITAGSGNYKLINENPAIATATLEGNTVTVNSTEKGWSGIIVSDEHSYQRIVVRSLYKNLVLDKDEINIGIKLGHTDGSDYVTVSGGNDGYTAVSENDDIATVGSISGNKITIKAVSEGTTNVTITDMMGVKKTVKVNVSVTTVPFSDSEKEEMLAKTSNVTNWDGQNSYSYGTFKVSENSGRQEVKWDYYGYYYMTFSFEGDLTVGKKTAGKAESKFTWNGAATVIDDVEIEILKNDGSRIWGIASKIGTKNDKDYLYTGYFCAPL